MGELIDGLCYQGVVGFNAVARSYVACAALSFILILVTFTLWCRGVNNVDAWEAKARDRRAQEQARLQPVIFDATSSATKFGNSYTGTRAGWSKMTRASPSR